MHLVDPNKFLHTTTIIAHKPLFLIKEDNFEIRWITQPFVLTIVSIDPLHLEAGVARLKCFYKKEGVFTSKEVIGINGDLAHRLQVQMQRLV